MSKKVIGIDLGSTMSSVAIIEGGVPTVIANEDGQDGTPSIINLFNPKERKVGELARRQRIMQPKETVNIIKRFMGATYEESSEALKHIQYDVVNSNGMPRVSIQGKLYSPEELSAMILSKMKKIAEDYVGETITDAVITVPAYFSDAARTATKSAGEIAGLNVLRVIAEPTAALLASKIDMKKGGKFMVTDFGGATTDNSVADISDGIVEILSTNGDVYLGGHDIDVLVGNYIIDEFHEEHPTVNLEASALSRIYDEAEKAKCSLSQTTVTDINIPYIGLEKNVPVHISMSLTRAKFEQIITPLIDRLVDKANGALKDAKLKGSDLDGILLVGGSCRIPLVEERLKSICQNIIKDPNNLDVAVAKGAAIQANTLAGGENANSITLLDVTPLAYGIETMGGVMTTLVEANTTIPCKKEQVFSTAADNQTAVTIRVLQGNRPMAKDNKEIGIFNLDGIVPAPKGVPQIEVTFNIDSNGILNVSAKDKGTGKEQHITIQSKTAMSKDEIAKAKADAEANKEADAKAKEVADTINKGESIAFSTEKSLKDVEEKISAEEKTEMETLVSDMRKAVADKDVAKINELEKTIQEKWNVLAQKIYAQPNQSENTETNA